MRKWVIPLACLMLITTGGCGGEKSKEPKSPPASEKPKAKVQPGRIPFEPYSLAKAPAEVQTAAEENKAKETALLVEAKGKYWLLLTRGLKPTGGYAVRVLDVYLDVAGNGISTLKVAYKYIDPDPNQFVTQVLTYPVEVVLLKGLTRKPDQMVFEQDGRVIPESNAGEVSRSFKISTPQPGDAVTGPLQVVGQARVFEAVFQVRLEDVNGNILSEQRVMASEGAPGWGDFNLDIPYPSADGERTGMLRVFTYSPKDGSVLDQIIIPLKLR